MKNFLVVAILFLPLISVFRQTNNTREKNFNVRKTLALEGYDPVSYFDNLPREGEEGIRFSYKGITYQFANATNLTRFKSNPEKFEPAYGGWCAFAMGETGEKVKIDPETFKILDGKLYVFYNFWGNNTLKDWNKNEKQLKAQGDQNWSKFVR